MKKKKIEKDYIDIKLPTSTYPIFGPSTFNQNRQDTQLLRTDTEEKISLRDYLLSSKENNKESLKSRNEEICDLEKSRLEMRLTTLLEKEKEVFNKTRELEEIKRYGDQLNTKREPTNEDFFQKNERSKGFDTINFEEVHYFFCK